jgi:hypothetical protein
MRKLKTTTYFLFLLIAGCVEPFSPKTQFDVGNALVVEGMINAGGQSAQVTLSRTVAVDANEKAQTPREQLADVKVEEQGGTEYQLPETGPGNYQITGINFDPAKKYRLKIRTTTGATYESEFVEPIITPPLDSVSWRTIGDVLSIEANTHDATNKAKYFIWSFEETYEYTSQFGSNYIWHPGGTVTPRPWDEGVFKCWLTLPSKSIIIGTTRQLNENILRNYRINSIPRGSLKLRFKYSLLAKQRAISEEEYEFWNELQKTTQDVGGLFDPMPTQVKGNISCTSNPSEPALGYFSAGTVSEKRVFIRWDDLPADFKEPPFIPRCEVDSVSMNDLPTTPGPLYIITTYGRMAPEGYIVSTHACTDCTSVPGGVNKKPIFWE